MEYLVALVIDAWMWFLELLGGIYAKRTAIYN